VVSDRQTDTHTHTQTSIGKNILPRFRGENYSVFNAIRIFCLPDYRALSNEHGIAYSTSLSMDVAILRYMYSLYGTTTWVKN